MTAITYNKGKMRGGHCQTGAKRGSNVGGGGGVVGRSRGDGGEADLVASSFFGIVESSIGGANNVVTGDAVAREIRRRRY